MELVNITVRRGNEEEVITANPKESILAALRGED